MSLTDRFKIYATKGFIVVFVCGGGFCWWVSYPFFSRDLQLDLLLPQLLPLAVVPAERSPLLLDQLLPSRLRENTVIKICVDRGMGGDTVLNKKQICA